MRIAQVAPLTANVSPDSWSDIGRQVFYFTEEMVNLGHEVTLFASADSQTQACLRPQSILAQIGETWVYYHMLMLEQVFKMEADFDLIHNHLDFLAAPLARRHRASMLTTIYTPLRTTGEPLYREYHDLALAAPSEACRRHPFPWLNWQGVIYPGLPGDLYPFQERPGKYLAFYGTMAPLAGLLTAIEIASRAGMELKIASDSLQPDVGYLEELKPVFRRARAEYVGELSSRQKQDFLQNAFALFLPIGKPEHLGLNSIEAMAYGTPVIACHCGYAPEIVQSGITGFTFQTVQEAIDCIEKIPALSRKRCRQIFEERFTVARMAQEYVTLYEKLAR